MKQLLLLIKKETAMCHGGSLLTFAWMLLDSGGCPDPQVTPSSALTERPHSTLEKGQCSSLGVISNQVAFLIKIREKKPVLTQ